MIRAYIVDDERLAVQRLARLLKDTGRVTVAGSATRDGALLMQHLAGEGGGDFDSRIS